MKRKFSDECLLEMSEDVEIQLVAEGASFIDKLLRTISGVKCAKRVRLTTEKIIECASLLEVPMEYV